MKEEIDFYEYGVRKAGDIDLKKIAEMIEKKYGTDARMEFEIGALLEMQNKTAEISQSLSKNLKGTKNFGVEGVRNNSYFGRIGTSKTHKSDGNYNEPKIKK